MPAALVLYCREGGKEREEIGGEERGEGGEEGGREKRERGGGGRGTCCKCPFEYVIIYLSYFCVRTKLGFIVSFRLMRNMRFRGVKPMQLYMCQYPIYVGCVGCVAEGVVQ